jgi:hypothetical protein
MKTGPAAVALAGSYALGRMRKPQWALALAGAVVARRLRAQGGDALGGILQSPGTGKLGEDLRKNVAAAGKAAAVAAAAHRMDALSDRIAQRTAAVRGTADTDTDTGPQGDSDKDDKDKDDQDKATADSEAEDSGEAADQEAPDREEREAGSGRRAAPRSGSRSEAARQKGAAEAKRSPAKRAPSRAARDSDSPKAAGRGPSRRTGSAARGGARTSGREER